jgi:hypothetical protein
MEATHPEQVAYGGRFDDDVVEPATERLLL